MLLPPGASDRVGRSFLSGATLPTASGRASAPSDERASGFALELAPALALAVPSARSPDPPPELAAPYLRTPGKPRFTFLLLMLMPLP